jgi:hypothetical protein
MRAPPTLLRAVVGAAVLLLAAAIVPAAAQAHGILGRAYLPIPAWVFAWAAGIVLVISFIALGAMWSVPRLEHPRVRALLELPRLIEPLCGAVGILGFGLVVVAGLAGTQLPLSNVAPTAVFVLFWVCIPLLSAVFGDVFAAFSPWRSLARCLAWTGRHTGVADRIGAPFAYPQRLGRWPAAAGLLAFGWVELVYVDRRHPDALAVLAAAYAAVQLVGMAAYGIDTWCARADGFGVAFNLYGRLAPLSQERGGRTVLARPPLSGLAALPPAAGTVAVVATMIGTTTFDGAANGPVWRTLSKPLSRGLGHLGLATTPAVEITFTVGLLVCILLCAGLYRLGIKGMAGISPDHTESELAGRFIHTLVPIAFGYLVAHYCSLVVSQGQAAIYLVSDPLGHGADLFGTAGFNVNYRFFSATFIWYVQILALIAGHVAGLASAHDRALVVYGDPGDAVASQRWMLVVMVAFTSLGLWLLSAVYT